MQLHIRKLNFPAVIGIHEWEKERERQFVMDIMLEYDASKAIANDDFSYALDYGKIERFVLDFSASKHWNLIETLAQRCAEELIKTFSEIEEITISVVKRQAMDFSESVTATAFLRRSSL